MNKKHFCNISSDIVFGGVRVFSRFMEYVNSISRFSKLVECKLYTLQISLDDSNIFLQVVAKLFH